jgi:hypothetical protein
MRTKENAEFIGEYVWKQANPMWEAVPIYQEDLINILV